MSEPGRAGAQAPVLILNVDDTEAIRYARTRILERAGFEVIEAATGEAALREVATRQPALVLLDVALPDVNGLEVCRRIKQAHPHVLVLQTSASYVNSSDRVRGLEGGADSYLAQPIAPEELVAAVRALLRLRRAEEAMRLSEARYRLIVESAIDFAIFTTDLDGRVLTWSRGAEALLGWTEAEIIGQSVDQLFVPEDRAAGAPQDERAEALAEGRAADNRWHLRRDGSRFFGNGSTMPLREPDGTAFGFLKILRDRTAEKAVEDAQVQLNETLERRVRERTEQLEQAVRRLQVEIEERRQAEAQLRQAQKMEAVGQLTGGIAHDFNNLLTAILGGLEVTRARVSDPRVLRLIDGAMSAAQRGSKLTAQLLAFARKQHLEVRPLDPNQLVEGLQDLIDRTIGSSVVVRRSLMRGAWSVLADPNQLETALLNLMINARDAMPGGGVLTIGTQNWAAGAAGRPPGLLGDFVEIFVQDTGTGMSEEVQSRVFEPFFTTKQVGKGTGLGLSMVYGVAKQSGGDVQIESEEGKGTNVRLFLPRTQRSLDRREISGAVAPAMHEADLPGRTVLVADDDPDVRRFTAEGLRLMGHTVIEAADGRAALAELADAERRIDLMIVDLAMPGMGGAEVAAEVLARRPELPILLVTGYSDAQMLATLAGSHPILKKPFLQADLAAAVRSLVVE